MDGTLFALILSVVNRCLWQIVLTPLVLFLSVDYFESVQNASVVRKNFLRAKPYFKVGRSQLLGCNSFKDDVVHRKSP